MIKMKVKEFSIREATPEESMAYYILKSLRFCTDHIVKCENCPYNEIDRNGLSACHGGTPEGNALRILEGKEIILE
jgi:hypothetical protein